MSIRIRSTIYIFSLIIVIITGFAAYSNSFNNEFIFDDRNTIIENPFIRKLDLTQIWNMSQGRFIGFLSFALNFHFHKFEVSGFHITNLTIHILNAMLVAWLVLQILSLPVFKKDRLFQNRYIFSFLAALLFVSHPIQMQSITYIVQRFTSFSALFYLLSLNLYLKARLLQLIKYTFWSVIILIFSGFSLSLAVLTKETSYTYPLIVILIEIMLIQPNWRINLKSKTHQLLLLLVAILVLFGFFIYDFDDIFRPKYAYALDSTITSYTYLITQFGIILSYIKLMFLPINQMLDHGRILLSTPFQVGVIMPLFIHIGIIFAGIKLFPKYRLLSFGIFWFYITLSVESSIIPIEDLMVEHRLYLPSVGFFIFVLFAIYYLMRGRFIYLLVIFILCISSGFAYMTWERNLVWRNAFSVWDDNISKAPDNPRPYNSRGIEYSKRGDNDLALKDFNRVLELNPNYVNALGNRSKHYEMIGEFEIAIKDYSHAINVDKKNLHRWHSKRSRLYHLLKKYDAAADDLSQAISIKPLYLQYYLARGKIYFDMGDMVNALNNYNMIIQLNRDYAPAVFERMRAYLHLRDFHNAYADYQRCLELRLPISEGYLESLKQQFDSYFEELDNKPNIILISTYGQDIGLTKYMPVLKELITNSGGSFENAITSSPQYNSAFLSMLTGRYIHNFEELKLSYKDIIHAGYDDTTIATIMQDKGFNTTFIGEYFSGYTGNFDFGKTLSVADFPIEFQDPDAERKMKGVPPGWNDWHGLEFKNSMNELIFNDNGIKNHYIADRDVPVMNRYMDRITDYLDNSSEPFFMWVNYISLHDYSEPDKNYTPIETDIADFIFEKDLSDKPEYIQNFVSSNPAAQQYTIENVEKYYQRLVQLTKTIDDLIAGILDNLSEVEKENTFIIYLSASGGSISRRFMWQGDLAPYDESIRIPMIISGPGIAGDSRFSHVVNLIDIFPTILDIAEINYPWKNNGRSLTPIFSEPGIPVSNWRHSVLSELGEVMQYRWDSMPPKYTLFRSTDFKYIEYANGTMEYYNLLDDPLEFDNRINELTDKQKRQLQDELEKQKQLNKID
jgi:protein O-mannosyl-transferase